MENFCMIIFCILFGTYYAWKPTYAIIKADNKKAEFKKHREYFLLSLIVVVGCLVRTVGLGDYPAGLNQDEASIGYEAFSLANFGIDRNGVSFPVHFISWGSGQNALYAYLCIPFVMILGLTPFSVRIVMALVGCKALYVLYKLLKLTLPKYAIFGTFLLAINPWHIEKSRWALESNILPELLLFGVLLLVIALSSKKLRYFVFSGCVFGLSCYAYGTTYFLLPVFLGGLFIYLLFAKKVSFKETIVQFASLFVIALPIIAFVILNLTDYDSFTMFGLTIPKLYYNRQTFIFNVGSDFFSTFFANAFEAIKIIFYQHDGLSWSGMPFFGTTYVLSTPLFVYGVVRSIKEKKEVELPLLFWLFASILMLFFIEANINRANALYIPMIYFTIRGVTSLAGKYKEAIRIATIGFLVLFFVFVCSYFGTSHQESVSFQFFDGAGEAMVVAEENFDEIYVTSVINEPYIIYLFYTELGTEEYLENRIVANEGADFEYISDIGNVHFYDIDLENLQSGQCYIALASRYSDADLSRFDVQVFGYYLLISPQNA